VISTPKECVQQPLEQFKVNVGLSQMNWLATPQFGACCS